METGECGEEGTAWSGAFDRTHLETEGGHARSDEGLRDGGEGNHEDDASYGGRGKGNSSDVRRRAAERAEEPDEEEDDAAKNSADMHASERVADDGAGGVAGGENGEGAGGNDEAQEDVGAEPEREAEEFDGAEHEGRVAEEEWMSSRFKS